MRIALVISVLSSGGSERVLSTMANYWAEHGETVNLITLASEEMDFYALHPQVQRVGLRMLTESKHWWDILEHNLNRLRQLRHALRSFAPDIVISFIDKTNLLTLAAAAGLRVPVVVSERIDPRQHQIDHWADRLRRCLYPHSSGVVVQTESVRDWALDFLPARMVWTIPNPVALPLSGEERKLVSRTGSRTIIAVGRLTPQKGFDLLIHAFSRLATKHADWSLVILGEGEEQNRLQSLATELGIAERVSLPGRTHDLATRLRQADLFVLSSRFEGFPNALLEAMACGLAVISFDCPSGPREIIRDGVDGILIPPDDLNALVRAMDQLMSSEAERTRLGSCAVRVVERFSIEKIMNRWESILAPFRKRKLRLSD